MNADAAAGAAAEILGPHLGLRATAATAGRLASCVQSRAALRGTTAEAYLASLAGDPAELEALIDVVTVQQTSFFREPAHFDVLARHLLGSVEGAVTVWSAGCATGQEAYSLAMLLDEMGVPDWRVVASDVSAGALARAAAAVYTEHELTGLSAARRSHYLRRSGERFTVVPALRERVTFARQNLATDPVPFGPGRLSVAFCRNVLIYLRRDAVAAFLDRLHGRLAPGGHLFVGASELLWRPGDRFRLVRFGDVFAYRRAESGVRHVAAGSPRDRARLPVVPRAAAAQRAAPAGERATAPDPFALRRAGERAAREGRHTDAVSAFRQALFVAPDDPISHLQLGLALEAIGDATGGRRAFRAARDALGRADRVRVEADLEGYRIASLEELLLAKLGGAR